MSDPKTADSEIKAPEPKSASGLNYKPPVWSGPPPPGARIEILKEGLIIGSKELKDKHYFVLGRQEGAVDVLCEHGSISRMHAILQFKDTGEAYLYDLGSTHGTRINKRNIPGREYIRLNHSDLFKLGESTRLYIYTFDQDEPEGATEEKISTETQQKESRKERMLKLYEENKKQQENLQSSLQSDKVGWGMKFENDDTIRADQRKSAATISDEDIERFGLQFGKQINYSALKEKSDLTDPQKAAIKKAESTNRRIEKLTNELEGIQAKQAKMLDLTDGQQQRYYKIETELQELRETLDHQEENIRNMICKFFLKFNIV